MAKIVADLHLHSNCSDGLNTPEEISELVEKKGVKVFSLTDHDSVTGHSAFNRFTNGEFIPGIELTSTIEGTELHILGYFIDSANKELLEVLDKIAIKRKSRLLSIIEKLSLNSDIDIDKDEVIAEIGTGSYNRLNLARFFLKKGFAMSLDECFSQYLGESGSYYEAVDFFTSGEAINLIHNSGGLAFLAHPFVGSAHMYIPRLVEEGLNGIEVYHPSHSAENVRFCLDIAAKYSLGICGGSDFHGTENPKRQIKSFGLDEEQLDNFLSMNPGRDLVRY